MAKKGIVRLSENGNEGNVQASILASAWEPGTVAAAGSSHPRNSPLSLCMVVWPGCLGAWEENTGSRRGTLVRAGPLVEVPTPDFQY